MSDLSADLNKTIAAAVNAKVEASVMEALSGDEVMSKFITAALTQEIEVDRYSRGKNPTFLNYTVKKAVQIATKDAVEKLVEEARPEIEKEVRKQLRARLPEVAETLVDGFRSARYSVKVSVLGEDE